MNLEATFKKLKLFLIFGGLTFLLYYFILWVTFNVAEFPYPYAVAIAYSFSVAFHFFGNRKVTFSASNQILPRQIYRYLVMAGMNYLIQLGIIQIFYIWVGINFYVSALLGVVATMISGYFIMDLWVFKERRHDYCS